MLAGAGAVAAGGTVAVLLPKSTTTNDQPPEPLAVEQASLPRDLFERGEYRGRVVRVGFELPLTPTADPLVWEYRPGLPPEHTPPTYRVHFDTRPEFGRPPHVVTGTVSHLDPDARRRVNRVPGVVVITSASVARPSP